MEERKCLYCRKIFQTDIPDGYSRKEILLPQVFCKIQEAQKRWI